MINKIIKWYEQEWLYKKKIIYEWKNSYLAKYFSIDGEFGHLPSYWGQMYDGYKLNRLRLFIVSIEWGHIVMSKAEWESNANQTDKK